METELKEVGLTFALGGLAFFGFWQIIRLIGLQEKQEESNGIFALLVGFLSDKDDDSTSVCKYVEKNKEKSEFECVNKDKPKSDNRLIKQVALVAMIFGMGFILEDFSKSISAERDPEINSEFFKLLDTDKNLRLRSLFDVRSTNGISNLFKTLFSTNEVDLDVRQKPIFIDLKELNNSETTPDPQVTNHLVKICTTPVGTNLFSLDRTNWFNVSSNKAGAFKSEVNLFYELARNRVVKQDTYQRELQEIYGRVAFERSCALLCLLLGVAFICLMMAAIIARLKEVDLCLYWIIVVISGIIFFMLSHFAALAGHFLFWLSIISIILSFSRDMRGKLPPRFFTKTITGLAVCYFGFVLARTTFREEHTGMDLRVMGFYMTLCNDFRNEQKENKSHSEPSIEKMLKIPVVLVVTNQP